MLAAVVAQIDMQDQLAPAVAAAFPDAAQFVLSAQQLLASSITPDLAAGLRSVLVYGAGLQAFDALSALIQAGVDAGERWAGELSRAANSTCFCSVVC